MSDFSDAFSAFAAHLRREHARLEDCVRQVENSLAPRGNEHQTTLAPSKLPESLEKLRTELHHHFQEEEDGGCLEEAISRLPSLVGEFKRLKIEHAKILDSLETLLEISKESSGGGKPRRDLRGSFREFAEMLRGHESAENRILGASFGVPVE